MKHIKELKKIDINQNINELLMDYPEIIEILTYEYGLYCVNCFIAEFDTLKDGAKLHGIKGNDFKDMIKHLEVIINSENE